MFITVMVAKNALQYTSRKTRIVARFVALKKLSLVTQLKQSNKKDSYKNVRVVTRTLQPVSSQLQ